ncbi:MAG: hypothetical protein DBY23_01995 [Bacillota bacterium]|nr:MAG: hypothetical protein DBY23_01995 [Bacillota bacterium]
MEKVNFNIGYQYLGVEYGLIPFIDIKYMDEKGREYDALENILLNKMENNQFLRSEVEEETLKLIEKCSSSATELSCAGIIDTTGRSYVASKGSFSNPLLEIPSRITINHKYLLNQDISVQDKCSIISKMFLNLYYNSKKKNSISFGSDDSKSLDFGFFYGDIDIKEMDSFSSNMEAMLYTMMVNHNRRSDQFIKEAEKRM